MRFRVSREGRERNPRRKPQSYETREGTLDRDKTSESDVDVQPMQPKLQLLEVEKQRRVDAASFGARSTGFPIHFSTFNLEMTMIVEASWNWYI